MLTPAEMGLATAFLGCKRLNVPVACAQRKKLEEGSSPRNQGSLDEVQSQATANLGGLGKNPSCCKTVNVNTAFKENPTSFHELY